MNNNNFENSKILSERWNTYTYNGASIGIFIKNKFEEPDWEKYLEHLPLNNVSNKRDLRYFNFGGVLLSGDFKNSSLDHADLSHCGIANADFSGSTFYYTIIDGTQLFGVATIDPNHSKAVFGGSFYWGSKLEKVIFKKSVILHTTMNKSKIEDTLFEDSVITESRFKECSIRNIIFKDVKFDLFDFLNCTMINVRFINTQFIKTKFDNSILVNIDWNNSKIRKENFKDIKPNNYQYEFYNGRSDSQLRKTLNDYKELSETYLGLKNQFNLNGRYNDMAWAYLKEKESIRFWYVTEIRKYNLNNYKKTETKKTKIKITIKHLLKKIQYKLYHIRELVLYFLFGFGEKPTFILGWSIFTIVLFGTIFYLCNSIITSSNLNYPISILDYYYFSAITFTTVGFGDIYPTGLSKIPVIIEALMGLFFYSLFVFSFGKRVSGR